MGEQALLLPRLEGLVKTQGPQKGTGSGDTCLRSHGWAVAAQKLLSLSWQREAQAGEDLGPYLSPLCPQCRSQSARSISVY